MNMNGRHREVMTILAVESDYEIRNILAHIGRDGLDVVFSTTMEDTILFMSHNKIPDLIILDMNLNYDAIELAKYGRSIDKLLSIIFISKYPWIPLGVPLDRNTKFLKKPFTIATLLRAVRELIIYDQPEERSVSV
jgi:two-component SAPR family response regulator